MKAFQLPLLLVFFVALFNLQTIHAQEDSIRVLPVVEDGVQKVDIYLEMSRSFQRTNIDSALYYATEYRRVAEENNDVFGLASALYKLGKINLSRDSVNLARDLLLTSLEYLEDTDNSDSLRALVLLYLGKSYTFQDNYSEAITYFIQSIRIAEELNNEKILSDLLDDIGLVVLFLEDIERALNYFQQSLALNIKIGNKINTANTLRNLGFVYRRSNEYGKAIERYQSALNIFQEENYLPGMAYANIGIGNANFAMKKYRVALEFYTNALEIAEKIGIDSKIYRPSVIALAYNRIGETELRLNNYDRALEMLMISSDISEKFGIPGTKANAALFISEVYEGKGDIRRAYRAFKEYNELSDSIVNARNISLITKLEMEYQYLKKQKERELERQRAEAEQRRRIMLYRFLISVAVILLILISIIFILYRRNQKDRVKQQELRQKNLELEKQNLERELAFKNKELTTSVMYQLKKNNFIWKISERLKGIALNLTPENRKNVKAIVKEMEANMSKESWEEFEFRFNEVHNDFYDNLMKDFPDLTPNELKLSAFLKLNMTTKDIATITYQTTHSITMARHRLRKKLKLDRDDNLVSFLTKY